jgi:hypothetical protein
VKVQFATEFPNFPHLFTVVVGCSKLRNQSADLVFNSTSHGPPHEATQWRDGRLFSDFCRWNRVHTVEAVLGTGRPKCLRMRERGVDILNLVFTAIGVFARPWIAEQYGYRGTK